jgi:hypothetical protein
MCVDDRSDRRPAGTPGPQADAAQGQETWLQLWSQLLQIRLPGRPDAGVQVARAVRVFPMKPGKLLICPVG